MHSERTGHTAHSDHNAQDVHTGHSGHSMEHSAGHTTINAEDIRAEHKAGHEDHVAHIDHTGHEQMFRQRFWASLVLSTPVLLYSPLIQEWLGFTMPVFPGSQWTTSVFSVIVFLYGGVPFLKMAQPEIKNRRPGMMTLISRVATVLVIASLLTIACGAFFRMPQFLPGSNETRTKGSGESDAANGERIYFTATNKEGERISYRGGPDFGGMMMGSYLTCAACHGPEAQGGTHFMHMQVMDAPDIRYEALNGEAGEHGGEEHSDEVGIYDLDDFRLAVIEGKHPDGEFLSRDMPRWEMSDQDLVDLFEFLKSLQ